MSDGVNLNPNTFVDGGLFSDIDFEITKAQFALFNYGGKADPAPAIILVMDIGTDKPAEQAWTVGKAADWMPSEDGKRLLAIGKAKALNNQSNGALLLASMVNAGLPPDMLGADISVLVGLCGHMDRVPAPRKRGEIKEGKEDTVLLVTSISSLPGEKKVGKAGGKKVEAAAAAGGDTLVTETQDAVMEVVAAADGPVPKKALANRLLPLLKDMSNKAAILKLAVSDEFLSSAERPWSYEGGEISLG